MKNYNLTYSLNDLNKSELFEFLKIVNNESTPTDSLGKRVNINDYCNKIWINATNFTVRMSTDVIGLASVYLNNTETKVAYITLVHVVYNYRGLGIGHNLLENIISHSKEKNFKYIDLEVSTHNFTAISLYQKNRFNIIQVNNNSYIMRYII